MDKREIEKAAASIAECITASHGIRLSPNEDGSLRVYIVRTANIGWRWGQRIWIYGERGMVVLSALREMDYRWKRDGSVEKYLPLGFADIGSRGLVLPRSVLSKAGMADIPLVAIIEPERIVLRPDLKSFTKEVREFMQLVASAMPGSANRIAQIAVSGQDPIQGSAATKKEIPYPELVLPDASQGVVFRVVGNPYKFRGHWIAGTNGSGKIVLCAPPCSLCDQRNPDSLWLLPGIRSKDGQRAPAFLLAQRLLVQKIALFLRYRQDESTDFIIFHVSWKEGMCSVHVNPSNPLPDAMIEAARTACSDPEGFVEHICTARDPDDRPARIPMLLTGRHMGISHPSKNQDSDEASEAQFDALVSALEAAQIAVVDYGEWPE